MARQHLTTERKANRTRYARRRAAGLCGACGKVPARDARATCGPCGEAHTARELKRQRRLEPIQKALKICRFCDSREVMPGARICGWCHERRAEQSASYRQRRRDAGQCDDCGGPRGEDRVRCTACLVRQRAASALYRERLRARK